MSGKTIIILALSFLLVIFILQKYRYSFNQNTFLAFANVPLTSGIFVLLYGIYAWIFYFFSIKEKRGLSLNSLRI